MAKTEEQIVTSTRTPGEGTFEQAAKNINCVFDGTKMRLLGTETHVTQNDKYPQGASIPTDVYYCPMCGWMTFFIQRE